jgi:hypothetical protein
MWQHQLHYDITKPLLICGNPAIVYFAKRDLLNEKVNAVDSLWAIDSAAKILRKQQSNGAWKYPGIKPDFRSQTNYNQIETFRMLGELVEKFGFNRSHSAIENAAEFLFEQQTDEGDFRGIYGTQYSPNYSAAIMELLIKAGYANDSRIKHGLKWLLSVRQADGGWVIPFRIARMKYPDALTHQNLLQGDSSKPFSHMVTGVVLRAFAAHPVYRNLPEVHKAGELLASRFFHKDKYPDRKGSEYWTRFSFPFWFTDLLSALDTLSKLGFSPEVPELQSGLQWFREKQTPAGYWELKMLRTKDKATSYWLCLAICRVFRRFYEEN